MPRLRERRTRVDYTDFLSPAAAKSVLQQADEAPRQRRSSRSAEKPSVEIPEEPPEATGDSEKELKKKKKRKNREVPPSIEHTTEQVEPVDKPKKEKKRIRTKQTRIVDRTKRNTEDEGEESVSNTEASEKEKKGRQMEATTTEIEGNVTKGAVATRQSLEEQLKALRQKYEAVRSLRESEAEKLLAEARILAEQEKQTYERIISKLKKQVATLVTKVEAAEASRQETAKQAEVQLQLKVEKLVNQLEEAKTENSNLLDRIKTLEQAKSASDDRKRTQSEANSMAASASSAMKAHALTLELAQAHKLLRCYRLITSTDLKLIEAPEDDEMPREATELSCAVEDAHSGRKMIFDLLVPLENKEEIEFIPGPPQNRISVPSYLKDEISFQRSELTKFMRTMLDVVIRKKASDASTKN